MGEKKELLAEEQLSVCRADSDVTVEATPTHRSDGGKPLGGYTGRSLRWSDSQSLSQH